MNYISPRIATNGLLIIFSLVIFFHLLVLFGIIPFDMVWGGRLKDIDEMRRFEGVSIALNVLMLAIVAIYAGFLKLKLHQSILKITFWGMFVLFLFNTIGNLLALNNLETIIFTPLTAVLSLFSLRLALANQLPKQQKPN